MYLQGVVTNPTSAAQADGTNPVLNMGRAGEAIVAELHGKYFTECYRGNVYYASTTTAGVIIPISSTLTPTYSLWNPAGSGKLVVPICTLIGWTATTAALGSFVWHVTTNAGTGISSTAPFTAFGTGAPINANTGLGNNSVLRAGTGGTTTLVAASSMYRETGMSITPTTAATSVAPGWVWRDDWDGTGIIAPSTAIHLLGTTAIAVTATVTMIYYEVPL
jgi:hypothetical protein